MIDAHSFEAAPLLGVRLPALSLPSTAGGSARIDVPPYGFRLLVIYAYPLTGLPGVKAPAEWDSIPGSRGCTAEACSFRDHATEIGSYGAAVFGVSTQSTEYQREAVERLNLPFDLLSDSQLVFATAIQLPRFTAHVAQDGGGVKQLLCRLTIVVEDSRVAAMFYPITAPESHAEEVLDWLASR